MLPEDRYKVKHVGDGRHWGVMDMHLREIIIAHLPTAKLAMLVRAALIVAWNDGYSGAKLGLVQ